MGSAQRRRAVLVAAPAVWLALALAAFAACLRLIEALDPDDPYTDDE